MKVCSKCKESKELVEFRIKRNICKVCENDNQLNRRRTKEGKLKVIYSEQLKSSKKRNHETPSYNQREFVSMFINDKNYLLLYDNWTKSGYDIWLSPSFDRKDDYKPYSFDNLNRWMTWKDNYNKGNSDRKNGINNKKSKAVIGTSIKTGETIEFHSGCEAGRKGFSQSAVSSCCLGERNKHKGYTWKYKR